MAGAIRSQSPDASFSRWLHVRAMGLAAILTLAGVSQAWAQTSQSDPGAREVWITGRVLDDEGRPIGDVNVEATAAVVGESLSWALRHRTRTATDTDGGFALAVPFADLRYSISVEKMGWGNRWLNVMARRGAESLKVQLKRGPPPHTMRGTVVDDAGDRVVDATVDLITEYGYAVSTRTDTDGRLAFRQIPGYFGQGVVVARARGLVGAIFLVRAKQTDLHIRLVKPAKIVGRVAEKGSGTGLAGVTVTIRPRFASDFHMETTSDQNGTFALTGVPAGTYIIEGENSRHFDRPPRGYSHERPKLVVGEGETVRRDIEMQPVATVRGQVLDRNGLPVAGAIVGTQSSCLGDYRDQYRLARTDQEGRFALWTAHVDESLAVEAFAARHGLASARMGPLQPGTAVELTLHLAGTARIHGVVADADGQPIPDVVCVGLTRYEVSDRTDRTGRFDLGLVPLRSESKRRPYATFKPPRPPGPSWITYGGPQAVRYEQTPESSRYYQFKRVEYEPVADKEVELRVTLEPAELLTIAGKVLDRTDRPVPEARLHLLAGNAENWYGTVHPRNVSGMKTTPNDVILTDTTTDERGEWVMRVVRENEESMKIAYPGKTDAMRYSIVAEAPDRAAVKFVKDVTVPEGQTEIRIDLKLNESPPTRPSE